MNFKIFFTLVIPFLLSIQDIAMVNFGSDKGLEVSDKTFANLHDIVISNDVEVLSNNSSKVMMDMLAPLVIEFDASTGITGEMQGQGINNGVELSAVSESVSSVISVGPGTSISTAGISSNTVACTRTSDVSTTKLRSLMILETVVPSIEVHYLNDASGIFRITQTIRYENCIISSVSSSGSESSDPSETFEFSFTKACYRSFERNGSGTEISQSNACYDQTLSNQSSCACSSF